MQKEQINWTNIKSYLIGNYRYKLFYSKLWRFLMRKHIREQIEFRINSMDKECWNNGFCKMCGCSTPALQMADKSCKGDCYPEMMSKRDWKWLDGKDTLLVDKKGLIWSKMKDKFKLIK